MTTKQKALLSGLLSALLLLSLLLPAAGILFLMPSQFEHTFYGALNEKYDRLTGIEDKKLVVIGGSSVAFGYDSALLSQYTGYPTVNFGLYADLGTKIMMELAEDSIGEGDIILLAPEVDEQTLSLYFNGLSALKATDDDHSLLTKLDKSDREKVWGALWDFMAEKVGYFFSGAPNPDGVYNAGNFNEYGDIDPQKFPRPENVMAGMYDTGKTIYLESWVYAQAFVDYVNDFVRMAEQKGATVYYTFCPINRLSVSLENVPEGTEDALTHLSDGLLTYLRDALDCEVLGTPADAVMDEMYFYDSNVHLNDLGVPMHTARVADLLCEKLGRPANALETVMQSEGYTWREGDFVFRMLDDGTCALAGVEGTTARTTCLVIPDSSRGIPVTRITRTALRGCASLNSLVISPDSPLREVESGAFEGLLDLYGLYCFSPSPMQTFPTPEESNLSCFVPGELLPCYREAEAFSDYDGRLSATPSQFSEWKEMADRVLEDLEQTAVLRGQDDWFLFESTDGGLTWSITGLTEEGKTMPVLSVPGSYTDPETGETGPVTIIGSFAFAGATELRSVVVFSDANVCCFSNYAFADSSVTDLYLYLEVTDITTTVNRNMLTGARPGFHLWIGEGRVASYANDYGWSTFAQPGDDYYRDCTIPENDLFSHLLSSDPGNANDTPTDAGPGWLVVLLAFGGLAVFAAGAAILSPLWRRKDNPEESADHPAAKDGN